MKRLFLTSFCVVFISALSYSSEDKDSEFFLDKASSELVYEEDQKESTPQKLSLSLKAQQITGFIESTDFVTNLSASFNYPIQESLSFSITQSLNRNYYILRDPVDRTGLWWQDTVLSLSKTAKWIYDSQFAFGLSSTLPISYYSRLNKVSTVTALSVSASINILPLFQIKNPVIKELSFSIAPALRYYFSEPVTSTIKNKGGRSISQTSGGSPLPRILFGAPSLGMSLKVSDKLSFSSSVGRWAVVPYESEFKSKNKFSLYDRGYFRQYYSISLSAQYRFFKSLSFQLSYSHLDRRDKAGRIQPYTLFDDQVSSWLVSVSYSFSKNKDTLFRKQSQSKEETP